METSLANLTPPIGTSHVRRLTSDLRDFGLRTRVSRIQRATVSERVAIALRAARHGPAGGRRWFRAASRSWLSRARGRAAVVLDVEREQGFLTQVRPLAAAAGESQHSSICARVAPSRAIAAARCCTCARRASRPVDGAGKSSSASASRSAPRAINTSHSAERTPSLSGVAAQRRAQRTPRPRAHRRADRRNPPATTAPSREAATHASEVSRQLRSRVCTRCDSVVAALRPGRAARCRPAPARGTQSRPPTRRSRAQPRNRRVPRPRGLERSAPKRASTAHSHRATRARSPRSSKRRAPAKSCRF